MKESRVDLERYLNEVCINIALDMDENDKLVTYLNEKYNIPRELSSDLICFRMTFSEVSEFVLFCMLDGINKILNYKKKVESYYTSQEINKYRNSRYKQSKIKFPIKLKMIQVDEDQWIGKIDVKFLMKLRDAQMINYNANAQRTMQRIIRGDKEIYKISLNKDAVKSINESMVNGTFISNTITLNIPLEDYDAQFHYDESNMELVISKLKCFHISDGFHRYIAACQATDGDKNFNYNMELRIVNWAEPKVQTFIYQEDQKTPLKKLDSESLNMNKASNIIVNRINDNVLCNMKGLISRNNGIINFGEMASLVDWFYIKETPKSANMNSVQMKAVKEITENINIITEQNPKYVEKKWDYKLLLSVFCVFDYFNRNNSLDKKDMINVINKTYKELKISNDSKLSNKTPRKSLIEMVLNIVCDKV